MPFTDIEWLFSGSKKSIITLFLLFFGITLHATTYYSRANGTFATAGTWSVNPSGSPTNTTALTASDIFIIQSGRTVTVRASFSAASITIQSGGILTAAGNYTWTVPIINVNSGGTWNITTRNNTLSGTDLTNDGTISGTSGRITLSTASASFVNNGAFTVTTGMITLNNANELFTNNGSVSITTGRINVNAATCTNNGSISFTSTGRLIFTSGSLTNAATGSITCSSTITFTLSTGSLYNNNTNTSINFGSTTVTISGTKAAQNMGGFTTTGGFTCSKTAGTLTLSGDVNCAAITKSGAGTLNLGTGNIITPTGTVALGTAGIVNGGSSTLVLTNATAFSGTASIFSAGTGTVNLSLAGAQTLSITGLTFYNLTLSGSGAKTITGSTTVNHILSMEGTATASAAPTYGSSATLQYNTATGRTAGVEWITPFAASGGVIIANTGAITANGAKVFNASVPLTINSGATLTTGANAFTFNGDLVNNGTWTASTGAITLDGTATQSIGVFNTTGTVSMIKTGGTATFTGGENGGAFTLSGSGTLDLGTGLTHTFSGTWTNTAGTLVGNTSTLNIAGTSTGTGVSFTANTSTVNFTGATAQSIPAFTYYDVNFSGAGIKTLSGTTGSGHVLTINASSELDLSSMTLNLSGSGTPLVNNGTFTASTSTVNYTNAGSTVITAVNYNNLNGTGGNRTLSTTANIGIAGTFTPGAGTYTVTNSTVDFNGGSAQNVPAFTYYNLIVSNAGIKSVLGSTTINCQTLTINDTASIEINADGGGQVNVLQ